MKKVHYLLFISFMVFLQLSALLGQTTNFDNNRRTDQATINFRSSTVISVDKSVETNQKVSGKTPLDLCVPEYSTGCAEGDGFMDFAVAEIENYESGCENLNGTGWSQYLELGPALFLPGQSYDFLMKIGYNNQHVSIWIDFNNDTELTPDEVILSDYELELAGELYTVPVIIPADALTGEHLMRARTNWSSACTDPCANYTYGEAEDYTVVVGEPAFGSLDGTVTLASNGAPVAEAQVTLSGLINYSIYTGADGTYELANVMEGDYLIVCSKEGYNAVSGDIIIIEDDTLTQNFQLTQPTIEINPLSISVNLDPNTTTEEILTIENNGDGQLNWSASLQITGKKSKDFMYLQFQYPVGVGGGEAGIETDGNYFYTTKWNGASFYKYALDGTYLGTFNISGVAAIRDLAYDGSMFYGGTGFSTVYEMDFENQVLVSSFIAPTEVRAIAYNPDLEVFYANNWSTPVVAFDKAGNNLGSFNAGPDGGEYYGFAYDNATMGGPFLWGYAQLGDSKNVIFQMQLPSGTETGFTLDMATKLNGQLYNSAGGLFAYSNLVLGKWTLGGLVQSEWIWGLELADAQTWISISPNTGTLVGGTSEEISVLFDATEMIPGTYNAQIHFTTTPNVGTPVVNVSMIVSESVPPPPENLTVTDFGDCAQLCWDAAMADSFSIYNWNQWIANTTEYCYIFGGSGLHLVKVKAWFGGLESLFSPEVMMELLGSNENEPINLTAEVLSGNIVSLEWDVPLGCAQESGYNVFRNGEKLNTNPIPQTNWADTLEYGGTYEYYVTALYYFGESDPSNIAWVVSSSLVNNFQSSLLVYPNPVQDILLVQSEILIRSLKLTDINGKILLEIIPESNVYSLEVSPFETGIYFLHIITDRGTDLQKIIIGHQ